RSHGSIKVPGNPRFTNPWRKPNSQCPLAKGCGKRRPRHRLPASRSDHATASHGRILSGATRGANGRTSEENVDRMSAWWPEACGKRPDSRSPQHTSGASGATLSWPGGDCADRLCTPPRGLRSGILATVAMSRDQLGLFELPSAPVVKRVAPAPQDASCTRMAGDLPASLRLGTSSWTFPGWAGLVYDREAPERVLTHEGLTAYAAHPLFRTVCIDRTF